MNPRYPVYIISKGRSKTGLTFRALENIGVDFKVAVEPQEFDEYADSVGAARLIRLPFSNLGLGSIPARNFVWEHALQAGHDRHWILDDNIGSFRRLNRNLQIKVASGTIFRCAEDFVDRYENVALAGFQYDYFLPSKYKFPACIFNTRVYSCILVKNDIPFRWRGKYNEDTDLSLQVLKAGWVTVNFNAFIQEKKETLSMGGGNSEIYAGNGRMLMAQSLIEHHHDVATVTMKYGRPQHHVNYKPFKGNLLIRRKGISQQNAINNYGMILSARDGHPMENP